MRAVHHSAIVTGDFELALRFWRDGLGLTVFADHEFRGDWPGLFGAETEVLRSVFLGDVDWPDVGIVELVQFGGPSAGGVGPRQTNPAPRGGFFLLSLNRDVEPTLAVLADLGFAEGVRQISMPAPGGKTVAMAVITAPDGVLVELIGPPR